MERCCRMAGVLVPPPISLSLQVLRDSQALGAEGLFRKAGSRAESAALITRFDEHVQPPALFEGIGMLTIASFVSVYISTAGMLEHGLMGGCFDHLEGPASE